MPLLVKCCCCKHLIFYTDSLEGLEELDQIFRNIRKCPSCGRELKKEAEIRDIKIRHLKTERDW